MPNFCSHCGAAQAGGSLFCAHCGARQAAPTGAPTRPEPSPATTPPPAYPSKKGSGLKILGFVLAFFVLAGVATLGGLYYVAHRLKQAVVEKVASAGVDLNSISSPATSSTGSKLRIYKACELLPRADAATMLGEPVEHVVDQGASCLYYGPPGLSGKLAQEGAAELSKQVQQPGAQVNGNDLTDSLSKIAGGLAAQAGVARDGSAEGSRGDVPLLIFVIDGDGKTQMTAITATKAIFGGIGKAASGGTQGFGAEIPGLGDRAVRLANLGLNVLQGNTLIRLVPGPVPDANNKTITIARAILPKI